MKLNIELSNDGHLSWRFTSTIGTVYADEINTNILPHEINDIMIPENPDCIIEYTTTGNISIDKLPNDIDVTIINQSNGTVTIRGDIQVRTMHITAYNAVFLADISANSNDFTVENLTAGSPRRGIGRL